MKAICMDRFGGTEVLRLCEVEKPNPAEDEVLIRIQFSGVNPVDWKIRDGLLQERLPHLFPLIPGWEAAGVVEQVGTAVTAWHSGDEVFAYCRKPVVQWGTYAEYVVVKATGVALKPCALSFEQAAGVPLAGLTAWQSLFDHCKLQRGQTILIHAGAGGVGGYAIQFAKHAGATVITTASAGNHDYVRALGADQIIDYTTGDFVKQIRISHPQGIDLVFDTIGGETQTRSYEVLRKDGALLSIVSAPDLTQAQQHGVRGLYCFVEPSGEQLREIARLLDSGTVLPPHVEAFPLEQAALAQEKIRTGHVRGKLVLRVK